MSILITGGTGFIGSHTVVELIQAGETPIIVDNLCNSKEIVLDRIEAITGKRPKFYKADLCDAEALDKVFSENPNIESVIHFAGLKAVGESVSIPATYYYNNLVSTLNLCEAMKKHGVKIIVFSSSATVYGDPAEIPIKETTPLGKTTNPYGETKQMIERILADIQYANKDWSVSILRYFNPVGAHKSGLMGEDPKGIPNNLFPYVTQVATGRRPYLSIFGSDYDTPDGTGVRDYIHVVDLADAHVKAIDLFDGKIGGCGDAGVACAGVAGNVGNDVAPAGGNFGNGGENAVGLRVYNLGTGRGTSVLELVNIFGEATGEKVPYVIKERRPGDIAENYCNASKAAAELGWEAQFDVFDMCRDSWNWQKNNPNGYEPA